MATVFTFRQQVTFADLNLLVQYGAGPFTVLEVSAGYLQIKLAEIEGMEFDNISIKAWDVAGSSLIQTQADFSVTFGDLWDEIDTNGYLSTAVTGAILPIETKGTGAALTNLFLDILNVTTFNIIGLLNSLDAGVTHTTWNGWEITVTGQQPSGVANDVWLFNNATVDTINYGAFDTTSTGYHIIRVGFDFDAMEINP